MQKFSLDGTIGNMAASKGQLEVIPRENKTILGRTLRAILALEAILIAALFGAPIIYYTFKPVSIPTDSLPCGVFSPSGCTVIYRIDFFKLLMVLGFTFAVLISLVSGSILLTKPPGSRKVIRVLGFLGSMAAPFQAGLLLIGGFLMAGINSEGLSGIHPTVYEDLALSIMVALNFIAIIIALLLKPPSHMAKKMRLCLQVVILIFAIGFLAVFNFSPSNFLNGSANGYREAYGVFSGYSSSALNLDCPTVGNCITVTYGGNTASVIASSNSRFYIADKIDASDNGALYPTQISCSSLYLCAAVLRSVHSETSQIYLGVTDDFGKSFSTVLPLPYSSNNIAVLKCQATSVCYFIYGNTYYSGNGGKDWTEVDRKTVLSKVKSFACLNNSSCLALEATNSSNLLFKTTDSGRSWSKLDLTGYTSTGPIGCGLRGKCFFWNSSNLGQFSLVLVDLSTGSSQQLGFAPLSGDNGGLFPVDLQCWTSFDCFALLESSSDTQQLSLWSSSDGGISWGEIAFGSYQLSGFSFVQPMQILDCPSTTTCKFLVVSYSKVSSGMNGSNFEYPILTIASTSGNKVTTTNLP